MSRKPGAIHTDLPQYASLLRHRDNAWLAKSEAELSAGFLYAWELQEHNQLSLLAAANREQVCPVADKDAQQALLAKLYS